MHYQGCYLRLVTRWRLPKSSIAESPSLILGAQNTTSGRRFQVELHHNPRAGCPAKAGELHTFFFLQNTQRKLRFQKRLSCRVKALCWLSSCARGLNENTKLWLWLWLFAKGPVSLQVWPGLFACAPRLAVLCYGQFGPGTKSWSASIKRGWCEDMWRYVKICEDMWRYVKVCEDMWGCVKMCEDAWRCVRICEDVWRCVKMRISEDMWRYVKIWSNETLMSRTELETSLGVFRLCY